VGGTAGAISPATAGCDETHHIAAEVADEFIAVISRYDVDVE
jgi:hypothetical protein